MQTSPLIKSVSVLRFYCPYLTFFSSTRRSDIARRYRRIGDSTHCVVPCREVMNLYRLHGPRYLHAQHNKHSVTRARRFYIRGCVDMNAIFPSVTLHFFIDTIFSFCSIVVAKKISYLMIVVYNSSS